MTNKGVIPFKFTDTLSETVEIGDFSWNIDRRKCPSIITTESERCDEIVCALKESPTVLWNCLAFGTLAAVNKKDGVQCSYEGWNLLHGNNQVKCRVRHKKEKVSQALAAVGQPNAKGVNGEVHVEIVDSFIADLTDPKNALIEDPDDAARLKVGKHELWLPKKVLSANSPFFSGLFKNNFKEGTDGVYDLKGLGVLKLDVFLQFVGIVHGIDMPIGRKSVEGLLHLADLFQCKVVLRRCEDYLRKSQKLTSSKKLLLGDRFNLNGLLIETVKKISVEEWKKLHLPSGVSPLLASLMAQKFRLMDV
ncbi:hypothetical protein L596_013191 [Steinernema carpocapsae]|uniref:BTB domain-containing protein n=1 Tax=Steinernema carpocapsae TaxID=34508 RepID=A0A4U5NZX4_STECR|nr:hypothetical protein L596_013191 [Steinernema carpocapsae]